MFDYSRVMVIVAHPDDGEPQVGGTIARFIHKGATVHHLIAVTPSVAKDASTLEGHKGERTREAIAAAKVLGVQHTVFLSFDEYSLAHTTPAVQTFDKYVLDFAPELIITHGEVDTQQDHVTVSKIAHTLARKNRIAVWEMGHSFPGGLKSDRPQPNLFVDITAYFAQKKQAVHCYKSQIERYGANWTGGITARDRYYGSMLGLEGENVMYAEAFVVAKMVWL
jgi:LmbE family N-acetylglucosaminyl deacetylase